MPWINRVLGLPAGLRGRRARREMRRVRLGIDPAIGRDRTVRATVYPQTPHVDPGAPESVHAEDPVEGLCPDPS
jgi:hypothetical protein